MQKGCTVCYNLFSDESPNCDKGLIQKELVFPNEALIHRGFVCPDRQGAVLDFAAFIVDSASERGLSMTELRVACNTAFNDAENRTIVRKPDVIPGI